MKNITTTPRLLLREFIPEDANALYTLYLEEETIHHTGDKAFPTLEKATEYIQAYTDKQNGGIGRWALILKENNEFLGFFGLKYLKKKRIVELQFALFKHFRGNGYAFEAIEALLHLGFKEKVFPSIYARTHVDNVASVKVLKKLNFDLEKEIVYNQKDGLQFKIDNPHLHVRAIETKETYPVRHAVLRQGRPIEDCAFEGDDEITTLHLGLFFDDQAIGVITLVDRRNETLPFGRQYQLRGMAIVEEHQGKGLGQLLLKESESRLKKALTNIIWFNAREKALSFYKRAGYKTIGDVFEIDGIGPHQLMVRTLY